MAFIVGTGAGDGGRGQGGKKDWPVPASGLHSAVCIDIVDRGMQNETWEGVTKLKHKCSIRWQIEERRPDGTPFYVEKWFTVSMFSRGQLRITLENWRGQAFTDEEATAFDLERLLGQQAMLSLTHFLNKDGEKRAKVTGVLPANKKEDPVVPDSGYVRFKDRAPKQGGGAF